MKHGGNQGGRVPKKTVQELRKIQADAKLTAEGFNSIPKPILKGRPVEKEYSCGCWKQRSGMAVPLEINGQPQFICQQNCSLKENAECVQKDKRFQRQYLEEFKEKWIW